MFKAPIHPDERLIDIPSETLPADEKPSFPNLGVKLSLNTKEAGFSLYLFIWFL